jgi:hypothetical protein
VIDQDGEVLANRNVPNGVRPILSVIGGPTRRPQVTGPDQHALLTSGTPMGAGIRGDDNLMLGGVGVDRLRRHPIALVIGPCPFR